jgi:hypothetical protein
VDRGRAAAGGPRAPQQQHPETGQAGDEGERAEHDGGGEALRRTEPGHDERPGGWGNAIASSARTSSGSSSPSAACTPATRAATTNSAR